MSVLNPFLIVNIALTSVVPDEASPVCLNITHFRMHINKWDVTKMIYSDKSAFRVSKHFFILKMCLRNQPVVLFICSSKMFMWFHEQVGPILITISTYISPYIYFGRKKNMNLFDFKRVWVF